MDDKMTEFIQFINQHKKIIIVGKGLFTHKVKLSEFDLFIGVKQSIGILLSKDILILNDFEGLFGLEPFIRDIRYIVFPKSPHIAQTAHPDNYALFTTYLKHHKFKGTIINYELVSNPYHLRDHTLPIIANITNSGEIPFFFINQCDNKKRMKIFVLGMYNRLGDNPYITRLIQKSKPKKIYKKIYKSYIARIYTNKPKQNLLMIETAKNFINVPPYLKILAAKDPFIIVRHKVISHYKHLNIIFFK